MPLVDSRRTCFQSVLNVIASDPGLRRLVGEFNSREDKIFRTGVSTYDPSIPRCGKDLIPILASAAASPIVWEMLERQLDHVSREESERILTAIKSGQLLYVPTIVGGAGANAAAFSGSYLENSDHGPVLAIDSNSRLGGQFRQHGNSSVSDGAIFINSGNGPIKIDRPGDPYISANCNFLGEDVPFQVPHATGKFFPTNKELGLPNALNQYFSARNLLGVEIISYSLNLEPFESGRIVLHLRNKRDGSTFDIRTDTFIGALGPGVEDPLAAFTHEPTKEMVKQELECPIKNRRIFTYFDILNHLADRTELFPREIFAGKRVAIIGGGHGSLTVVEGIVGMGPSTRGSVAALGGPDSIAIIGAKSENSEGYLDVEYERYGQLAVLINSSNPKPDAKDSLLTLFSNCRATELTEQPDGSFKIRINKKDGSNPFDYNADIVVISSGFKENTLPFRCDTGSLDINLFCNQDSLLAALKEIQHSCSFVRFKLQNHVQHHEIIAVCNESGVPTYYQRTSCDDCIEISEEEFKKIRSGTHILAVTAVNGDNVSIFDICETSFIEEQLSLAMPGSKFNIHSPSGVTELVIPNEGSIKLPDDCLGCCWENVSHADSLPLAYLGSSSMILGRKVPGVGYLIGPASKAPLDPHSEARRDVLGAPGITLSIINNTDRSGRLGAKVAKAALPYSRGEHWDQVLRSPELDYKVTYNQLNESEITTELGTSVPPYLNQGEALILARLSVERYLRDAAIKTCESSSVLLYAEGNKVHALIDGEYPSEILNTLALISDDRDMQDLLRIGYKVRFPVNYVRFSAEGVLILN